MGIWPSCSDGGLDRVLFEGSGWPPHEIGNQYVRKHPTTRRRRGFASVLRDAWRRRIRADNGADQHPSGHHGDGAARPRHAVRAEEAEDARCDRNQSPCATNRRGLGNPGISRAGSSPSRREPEYAARPGSRHPAGADRRQHLQDEPAVPAVLAAGNQHHARQGAAAGARSLAGFGRQRRTACAQRARQPAIPHQRDHAAGRRWRLRPDHRHRNRRQHGADHRRVAGAVRVAHRRRARHPDQARCLQQLRQHQRLWRQPWQLHHQRRLWRHGRTNPVLHLGPLFRQQCRHREPDAGL